ncbi:hypothetical protein DMUE_3838 [Dictyocoela muelleri]|nr:hypothetical protein DMUE_3838 [Dictyocoela muelleri]
MNREMLESLPPHQRKTIEKFYLAVINNEITPDEFFAQCNAYLGKTVFDQLFAPEKDIKTDKLEDVIEYSGVDLKQEMEQIKSIEDMEFQYQEFDVRSEMEMIVDYDIFISFIKEYADFRSIGVSGDAVKYLFYALRRYLIDMIEKMDTACFLRADPGRIMYNLRIENDIRRQLWFLKEKEKKDEFNFKDTDKKDKKIIQEREDLLIKKKMSNTVALAALGSQKKSWMDVDVVEDTNFLFLYAPVDEKEIEKKVQNRRITMDDFLYVLERDRKYNKSIFTMRFYYKRQ